MSRESTCCFTGHRRLSASFSPDVVYRGIIYLIDQGVDTFIVGGALGFDTLCALEVLKVKRSNPNIKLHVYAPCNNQSEGWNMKDKHTYAKILKKAYQRSLPF